MLSPLPKRIVNRGQLVSRLGKNGELSYKQILMETVRFDLKEEYK